MLLTTKRGSSAASGSPAARHRASSRNDACRSSGVPPPSSRGFSTGPSDEASCTTCNNSAPSTHHDEPLLHKHVRFGCLACHNHYECFCYLGLQDTAKYYP